MKVNIGKVVYAIYEFFLCQIAIHQLPEQYRPYSRNLSYVRGEINRQRVQQSEGNMISLDFVDFAQHVKPI